LDKDDACLLCTRLVETLSPAYHDGREPYEHAMAKSRVASILESFGYTVWLERPMPCRSDFDDYILQYRVDVYAEIQAVGKVVELVPGEEVVIDTADAATCDCLVVEIGGLSGLDGTRHGKNARFARRTEFKRDLICSQYRIPADRYLIFERDEVFSSSTALMSDSELLDRLRLVSNGRQ
jgi:hypothetical protein